MKSIMVASVKTKQKRKCENDDETENNLTKGRKDRIFNQESGMGCLFKAYESWFSVQSSSKSFDEVAKLEKT